MKVLSFDPGPSKTGAAWVSLRPDGWLEIPWGGHVENEGREIRAQLELARQERCVVAVEEIVGGVYKGRGSGAALLETSKVEQDIVSTARAMGIKVVRMSCAAWRAPLCRATRGVSDAQVALVLRALCPVRPLLLPASEVHVFDAAGLGIVVLAQENGRGIRLPMKVEAELFRLREEERLEREGKRQGAAAAPEVKRFLTRKQRERRSVASKAAWAVRKAGA